MLKPTIPSPMERAVSVVVGSLLRRRLADGIRPVADDDGRHHMGIVCPTMPGYQGRHRAAEAAAA